LQNSPNRILLTPPQLAADNIKERITCIRSHRERIFNVSVEVRHSKLVCHNYGHGGAGWTFLFGCVEESIRQFEAAITQNPHFQHKDIAVIGAGCYGLLTAIMLKQRGYRCIIRAKESDNLASHNAAGFFFPRPRKSSTDSEKATFYAMGIASYQTYLAIAAGNHPFLKSGAKVIPAYFGLDIDPGFASYHAQDLIAPPEHVIVDFGNGKQYPMMRYDIIHINAQQLMQQLHAHVQALQIPIVCQTVQTFDQLTEPIIFNCAGWGAKQLTNDARLIPVQGHLITLQQQPCPEQLEYLINVKVVMTNADGTQRDELVYYAPKNEGILGITFKRGCDSLTAHDYEFDRLLKRCKDFFGT
jgi:D-amino-acid oxidase